MFLAFPILYLTADVFLEPLFLTFIKIFFFSEAGDFPSPKFDFFLHT